MSDLPVPPSAPGGVGHAGHGGAGVVLWDPTKAAPLDAVMAQAQRLGFPPGFGVSFPSDAKGSYTVSNWPDAEENPFQHSSVSQVAFIDQYTAQPLAHVHEGDLGPVSKTTSLGIALHEGRQFGFWNQVASLTGALAILVSCATSLVMWRKRRPAGLGAPRRAANRRVVAPVLGLAALLGTALPLLGLTLLTAMILEFLVVRRVPRLARAFGAY